MHLAARQRVINAFRHQRFLHDDGFFLKAAAAKVINAFRHQRFLHLVAAAGELATSYG